MFFSKIPDQERPRERLFKKGASSLTVIELLAILLRTGTHEKDVMELSAELLQEWGSLKGLSLASPAEILGIKGMKQAKVSSLVAALELGRRLAVEEIVENENWQMRIRAKALALSQEERELIVCFFLDQQERVVAEESISYGGLEGAYMDIPYLFRRALRLDADSIVVMHNHPDGNPLPSEEDKTITRHLTKCANLLAIQLKAHYVLAGGNHYLI